jgi:hypothetical protein
MRNSQPLIRGLVIGLCMCWAMGCDMKKQGTFWQGYTSGDGLSVLEIWTDEPMVFGPQTLHLYLVHAGATTQLPNYTLHNDGANLRNDQFTVTWPSANAVEIVMQGEEQAPETLRYSF